MPDVFFITDAVTDDGTGLFTAIATQEQLNFLLDRRLIYEDTVSDYVEGSGRRHFHPMHEIFEMEDVVSVLNNWDWAPNPIIGNRYHPKLPQPITEVWVPTQQVTTGQFLVMIERHNGDTELSPSFLVVTEEYLINHYHLEQ